MLRNMDPPLGFGNKCPYRLAYKKLIRMNMPLNEEGKVSHLLLWRWEIVVPTPVAFPFPDTSPSPLHWLPCYGKRNWWNELVRELVFSRSNIFPHHHHGFLPNSQQVHFTTTLFALIRENLCIKMRPAEEMDQADFELRGTIKKIWPIQAKKNLDLIVPPDNGEWGEKHTITTFLVCRSAEVCSSFILLYFDTVLESSL